ncbi:MAG: alpha/beta hydrolase [Candidatus Woesearchaeota archaeon]
MIYYPDKQDFDNCPGFSDYERKNYDGTRFYFKQGKDNESNNVIVFYHGNAGSTCDRSYMKQLFERTKASLIFVEYAGYSNDKKRPNIKRILDDVRNINSFIINNGFESVMVYGESIGTGPGSYHAKIGQVDFLIFVTPFYSLQYLAQSMYRIYLASILVRERYDNARWLKDYKGDIVIIHGSQDDIIPYQHSRRLYDNLVTENKEYIFIQGRGHNDLWHSDEYRIRLADLIMRINN